MIAVIDLGSQLTMNIARRIREHGVYAEVIPYTKIDTISQEGLEGIVLSGGQFSVYDKDAPMIDRTLLHTGVPALGICYGQQAIAHLEEGKVTPSDNREYGGTNIRLLSESPLFAGIPEKEFKVWMSHGDIVEKMPAGFTEVARSENGHIAAMQRSNMYAVQFHPEADHTSHGREILGNFVDICQAQRTWDPSKDFERIFAETEEKVRGKTGVGGVSGGVDSSSTAALLNMMETNSNPIFVDNGVLRCQEAKEVQASLEPLGLRIRFVDASERFLAKLKGVLDHDERRRIIGYEFVAVFEEEARKIPGASYLFQGTLYPDVVESVPVYGSSSKIRRHHNVGGLPEKLGLGLVEPFRNYFKDEVRKIAEQRLGLPAEIVWRHPFPGPGLAIRMKDEVTAERLDLLRKADYIFIQELKRNKLYRDISQAFAYLPGSRVIGVKGDKGVMEEMVMLRAVVSHDFMTADPYRFDPDTFQAIVNRIINEVKGVTRVGYDWTQKPQGTIEPW